MSMDKNNDRTPALRRLPSLYKTLSEITKNDDYLKYTKKEFIQKGMEISNCKMHPQRLEVAYHELMLDAGLGELT